MTASTHPADTSKDGERIDMSRAAMQQALEALLDGRRTILTIEKEEAAIAALRAALAEQPAPQEPVAWMVEGEGLYWTEERAIRRAEQFVDPLEVLPLYTTPPAPQPLTEVLP